MIGKISYHTTMVSMSRKRKKCFCTAVSIFSHFYFPHKAARNWNINKCQQKLSAVPHQWWSTFYRISTSENQQTQVPIYRYRYNKKYNRSLESKELYTKKKLALEMESQSWFRPSVMNLCDTFRTCPVARTLNDCVSHSTTNKRSHVLQQASRSSKM